MLSYCLKCRVNTKNKNPRAVKTRNRRIMVLTSCAVFGSKKLKFIKEQEAKELLQMIGIIPLLGDL